MKCESPKMLMNFECVDACDTDYTMDPADRICKKTVYEVDYSCEPGTYNHLESASEEAQCNPCLAGDYCDAFGQSAFTGQCLAGYYCAGGSNLPSPVQGYDDDPNEDYFTDSMGGVCSAGSVCPTNSASETLCTEGYYCPDEWMSAVDTVNNECDARFYCSAGATIPRPGWDQNSVSYGGLCEEGTYCDANSVSGTSCIAGKYLPYVGAKVDGECMDCKRGSYCETQGLDNPTGECDPGYVCEVGSASKRQNKCDQDFYCE
mmetsp:Transcript_50620/g.69366  ORF Transcript_50620/g.69366 Transcript_50620/m.69366 type:complete len:261 (+) Transcript_50620:152-934(+)